MAKARTILTRVVLGAAMIAAAAALLAADHLNLLGSELGDVRGTLLGGLVVVLVVLGFREVAGLARAAGGGVLWVSGLLGAVLLAALPVWRPMWEMATNAGLVLADVLFLLGAVVMLAFLEQMVRFGHVAAAARLGTTLLAVLYLAAGAALMLAIRMDKGVPALVVFLAAVKCADIGAYFTGVAVGRHKLAARLSPGKTWEGLVGGLVAGAGAALLAVWAFRQLPPGGGELRHVHSLGYGKAALFGVVVAAAGQFADLCESLLKRSAAVKDSGALVPAFGGVLDILDSPLLAAPVGYLLLAVL